MVRSLSKIVFCLLISVSGFSQTGNDADQVFRPQEYKDQDQFRNFAQRRNIIGKWQINQLKIGALVVRLHNNQKLIEGLKKMGNADLAAQKEYEQMAINKNIVLAFTKYYTFSKVYFFYSSNSDTLLKGATSGIFLDTNLTVIPTIEMKEKFYLIAESDDVYNSSIGFVRSDTAKFIKETGNAAKEAAIVIKNKYGHQLKDPFPFFVTNKSVIIGTPVVNILIGNKNVPIVLEKKQRVERHYAYVKNLNKYFNSFYNSSKDFEVSDPEMKPFLY
ncbi:MAG TPA: hypothetical protein VN026_12015 [Bacteroidia bacterium]|jgi:hypothetical protein|nr:hypothetical protein [Bacteroidia bacterium]